MCLMHRLHLTRGTSQYEFRKLDCAPQCHIIKDTVLAYTITWSNHAARWRCSCPGDRFHGKCWHLDMLSLVQQQPCECEPWAQWAEDAAVLQEEIHSRKGGR